jgi:hypothetical protein
MDHFDRRHFIGGTAAAAAALALGPAHAADSYPSHAISLINPFPPGGAADVVGRPLAAVLEPIVKQPVVIETKAGAAGAVGAQVAANAKPDGYTLLLHITSISGFAEVDKLFDRKPKFTRADFIPIARFVADPCVLLVNDKQPYKTLKDLTEDAKKRPDQILFSSSGLYGALHIPTALYMKAAGGLKMRHLPTNGGGPALTAFLGNNAQVLVSSISASLPQSLFVSVLRIPYAYLYPLIIMFCIVGVYEVNHSIVDVWIMLIMGIFGYALRKFSFDPAPLVLGLVIAPIFEQSLRQSLIMSNGNYLIFFNRPISAGLLVVCIILLGMSAVTFILKRKDWRDKLAEAEAGEPSA